MIDFISIIPAIILYLIGVVTGALIYQMILLDRRANEIREITTKLRNDSDNLLKKLRKTKERV